jgi:hypothetical protein
VSFGRCVFAWRDEPIDDIRAWARGRGEQMVLYDEHREGVVFTKRGPKIVVETSAGAMPESFWNGLTQTAARWYTERGRENP